MLGWLKDRLFKFVFWWKKRTGFIDFKQEIEVVGTVTKTHIARDGDITFDIVPDPEYTWSITSFGGNVLSKLHCEVVPWLDGPKLTAILLNPGDRVRVRGAWGFDGVHTRRDWKVWYHYVWEIVAAVARHQPNVIDGWFEIHPVREIERIG